MTECVKIKCTVYVTWASVWMCVWLSVNVYMSVAVFRFEIYVRMNAACMNSTNAGQQI